MVDGSGTSNGSGDVIFAGFGEVTTRVIVVRCEYCHLTLILVGNAGTVWARCPECKHTDVSIRTLEGK